MVLRLIALTSVVLAVVFGCSPTSPSNGPGTGGITTTASTKARFSMNIYPPTGWTHPTDAQEVMPRFDQRIDAATAKKKADTDIEQKLQVILVDRGYPAESVSAALDSTFDLVANFNSNNPNENLKCSGVASQGIIASERNMTVKACSADGKTTSYYTVSGTLTAISKVTKEQWNSLSILLRQKLEVDANVFFPAGQILNITPL